MRWNKGMVALLTLMCLADAGDDAFVKGRVRALIQAYEAQASRQTTLGVRKRAAVVRELAHLPYSDVTRRDAERLVIRILASDRSYRVRVTAARAAVRIGTGPALRAMYHALFGEPGRATRYRLLYEVLPEALEGLKHGDGIEWLARAVLVGRKGRAARDAGPLRDRMLELTVDGIARAGISVLAPQVRDLARASEGELKVACIRALATLGTGDKELLAASTDPDPRVRAAALAFSRLPPERLAGALDDDDRMVRREAIEVLAGRPARQAVPLLIDRLESEPDRAWLLEIASALNRLTGKEFGLDKQLWAAWWNVSAESFLQPSIRERRAERYFFAVPMRTERVLFVLDVSASMTRRDDRGRTRQALAGAELARTLASLPAQGRFSLFAFSGQVRRWPDRKKGYARRGRAAEATEWFVKLRPAGATNTYAALMEALGDPLKADTIVLLSDGNPNRCTWGGNNYSQHEQILAEVRRANRDQRIRIHTVALLTGALAKDSEEDPIFAAEFLRRLAAQNGGRFREVR